MIGDTVGTLLYVACCLLGVFDPRLGFMALSVVTAIAFVMEKQE